MRGRTSRFGLLVMAAVVALTFVVPAGAQDGVPPGEPPTDQPQPVEPAPPVVTDETVVTVPPQALGVDGEDEDVGTKGEVDDPAQKRLRWIIGGLVGLAVVILVVTVWFWRATSPKRNPVPDAPEDVPAGTDAPDGWADPATTVAAPVGINAGAATGWAPRPPGGGPLEGVRVPRRHGPIPAGHRRPFWADEHAPTAPAASEEPTPER